MKCYYYCLHNNKFFYFIIIFYYCFIIIIIYIYVLIFLLYRRLIIKQSITHQQRGTNEDTQAIHSFKPSRAIVYYNTRYNTRHKVGRDEL
jgi:hypothetical protein